MIVSDLENLEFVSEEITIEGGIAVRGCYIPLPKPPICWEPPVCLPPTRPVYPPSMPPICQPLPYPCFVAFA